MDFLYHQRKERPYGSSIMGFYTQYLPEKRTKENELQNEMDEELSSVD